MRTKLQVAFLIAGGFLGGALSSYVVPKVIDPVPAGYRRFKIDAQEEPLLLATDAGMKVGELRFSRRGCVISAEPGVITDFRRMVHEATVVLHTIPAK